MPNLGSIGIIIQARMGSSRLPGKILKKIGNKLLLEHILDRLLSLSHPCRIVIATSNLAQDDAVEAFCQNQKVDCFRGSEQNVLERYYLCAKEYGFGHIMRITGDNPFYDVEELDKLISLHIESKADYSHSFKVLPIGVGAEIFTFEALETSYQKGHEAHHLEHVNEYISDNPNKFNISELTAIK
jgi:spore coat polysaccharide biosynthesis protein SpsF